MTPALQELRSALTRLHEDGLRAGLSAASAERLVAALDRGEPISQAASSAGLDRRIARAAELAAPSDLPRALAGLSRAAAELDTATRRLRSAGSYPLVLAASVVAGGAVLVGAALPALTMLPTEGDLPLRVPALATAGLATLLLVVLAAVVLGRLKVPWVCSGWVELERYAFLSSLQALVQAGAPLPSAVRGAASWTGRRGRAAGRALARSLEAGAPRRDLAPLLPTHEATMLTGAAAAGTVPETVGALAVVRRVALDRVIPDAIVRIQAVALILAGAAVLGIGATFVQAYSRALVG